VKQSKVQHEPHKYAGFQMLLAECFRVFVEKYVKLEVYFILKNVCTHKLLLKAASILLYEFAIGNSALVADDLSQSH
jgi:hypothetical protein